MSKIFQILSLDLCRCRGRKRRLCKFFNDIKKWLCFIMYMLWYDIVNIGLGLDAATYEEGEVLDYMMNELEEDAVST